MTELLRIDQLVRRFGERAAVEDVSLTVAPGSIVALVGPNGAGKTTTMRMVCGVLPPTSGRVRVAGHDVWSDPIEAKRRLAWVPNDPQLYTSLTPMEHFDFVATMWQVEPWEEHARALAARFDLSDRLDTPIGEMSTGMKQKVALCGALLHRPDLLVLDEPMNGLDPYAIRTLREVMVEEARRGCAVVISSHLLALVDDVCTDIVVLVAGRMRWAGTRQEAHAAWPGSTLEEVFFRATGGP